MTTIILRNGDCVEVMGTLADGSVGAIVSDPPYGLRFMGKAFDDLGDGASQREWHRGWVGQAYRVLRPGGVIKAFGGTRTFHHLGAVMREAGFLDIRLEAWTYGSGFPKSMNIGKQIDKVNGQVDRLTRFTAWMRSTGLKAKDIDKALKQAGLISQTSTFAVHFFNDGQPAIPTREIWEVLRPLCGSVPAWVDRLVDRVKAEREVVGHMRGTQLAVAPGQGEERAARQIALTAPATSAAHTWDGWGTALKPSWEPVVVGRKP